MSNDLIYQELSKSMNRLSKNLTSVKNIEKKYHNHTLIEMVITVSFVLNVLFNFIGETFENILKELCRICAKQFSITLQFLIQTISKQI